MNPFWKTILTTALGGASLIGAHYSADWVANHTYRSHRAPQALAEAPRPHYVPVQNRGTLPSHFRRSAPLRPYRSSYDRR